MKNKSPAQIIIDTDWCKGCGICVAFCPKQVLVLNRMAKAQVTALEACTACLLCEKRCPDLAIQVITPQTDGNQAS
jgi:2-oxoglutarate ferredoxin oxidoreductase subunit delta